MFIRKSDSVFFVVGVISASKVGIKIEKKFVKTEKKILYNRLIFNRSCFIYSILIHLFL